MVIQCYKYGVFHQVLPNILYEHEPSIVSITKSPSIIQSLYLVKVNAFSIQKIDYTKYIFPDRQFQLN